MRRLQQRLLVFVVPALSRSVVNRFGNLAGTVAEKGVHTLLSMSVVDGDLHKNEIQDSQQFIACLRDQHMISMADYDRFVSIFQSRVNRVSASDILSWADELPVELWRFYREQYNKPLPGLTEFQMLQNQIVFTLCGLSMASYAGLYALVSDQKVHTAELQLLTQIMKYFEKPETLLRYVQQESFLSQAQQNILGPEIRRFVVEFVESGLLPLTLIQHVVHSNEIVNATNQTLWLNIIDEITEVKTRVIDDPNFFLPTQSFEVYEQAQLPIDGTVEQTRLSFMVENDWTLDSIDALSQLIDDEDERVKRASQLHDMALDTFGSIAQSNNIADDHVVFANDDAMTVHANWRAVLQRLLAEPKVTFELIETYIAENVEMNQRIDALQYIIVQLRNNRKQVYDQDSIHEDSALDNINVKTIQMLVRDIKNRMLKSIFAKYEREYDRAYFYHELLSAVEERDLCVAREMLKSELVNANNADKMLICELSDEVRTLLINHNYRLVMRIATMNTVHIHHLELMDLFQEGCIGLIKAVDKFDVSQNTRLSTYATWWIRQSIGRAIDDLDRSIRLPVHFLEFIRRYRREVIKFELSHQRPPLYHEIASILHISDKDVAKLDFWNRRIMSLHAPIGDDDTTSIGDYLVDDADISQTVEQIDLAENIQRVLQSLTDRERTIITLRFGLDGGGVRTLEEIGTEMGITRERVRQIESKTLADLRKSQRSLELYIKE